MPCKPISVRTAPSASSYNNGRALRARAPSSTLRLRTATASSTALAGAQAGDTVNFHLQWKDNVLTVSATLSGNADATTGDVIYDLSAATAYLDAVKEPAGFALWMSLADGDTKSSRFGHFVL